MKKIIFLFVSIVSISVFAQESDFIFKEQRFSILTGYRQDKIKWNLFSNQDYTREKLKDFNFIDIGPMYRLVNEEKIYFLSKVIVGLGKTSHATLSSSRVNTQNASAFAGSIKGKAFGVNADSLFHIGYPMRFGPFLVIGHTGFNYLYEKIDRKSPKKIGDNNLTFRSRKHNDLNWYNPLVGVELVLLPSSTDRYQFSARYAFRFGRVKVVSRYLLEEGSFTQKEQASLHTDSRVHIFELKGTYGFTDCFLLEGVFGYEYWKGKKKTFDYSFHGNNNGSQFDEKKPYNFGGIKRQAFLGRLGFSFQF